MQSRLRNLELDEAQYQALLARAASVNDILQISGRRDSVGSEIERPRGRINLIDGQRLALPSARRQFRAPTAGAAGGWVQGCALVLRSIRVWPGNARRYRGSAGSSPLRRTKWLKSGNTGSFT